MARRRAHVRIALACVGAVVLSACGLGLTGNASPEESEAGIVPNGVESGLPDRGAISDTTIPDVVIVFSDGPFDATPFASACDGSVCERVLFVTRAMFPGNLGGVAGADAKCRAVAGSSQHERVRGKSFHAWIAFGTESPATRLPKHGAIVTTTGTRIAKDWIDLTDGSVAVRVERDEAGVVVTGNDNVWTGVATNGTNAGAVTCTGWTSSLSTETGHMGAFFQTNQDWTDARSDEPCDKPNHLYCLED